MPEIAGEGERGFEGCIAARGNDLHEVDGGGYDFDLCDEAGLKTVQLAGIGAFERGDVFSALFERVLGGDDDSGSMRGQFELAGAGGELQC